MGKSTDIYVTFSDGAANADKPLNELIEDTTNNIRIALGRLLRREITIAVKGKDFNTGNASKYMDASSLAIVFVHPVFEADIEYQQELEALCHNFGLTKNRNTDRVFKISLEPLKKEISPYCLEELLSYDFFEKNIYNRKIKALSFREGEVPATLYGRLLDLAYDMSESLKKRESGEDPGMQKCIFLGLTTFDQNQAREEIRRELLHYGYKVLPSSKIPVTGEEFEKALIENLTKSTVAIQLMGSQYGDIVKGTKYSMLDYQNRIIKEYQQKLPDNGLKRFIWIPQNNKISDQRQALYLKRIRRDDASDDTEIIESPLETFKTILSTKLEDTNHFSKSDYENISKVFLLSEEQASTYVEELYSALSLSGLRVLTLDYEEQTGIYARYLQSLRDTDAVILVQSSENTFWLNSKLRDLVKSPGIGRMNPFKKVLIISRLLPNVQLIRMIKSKVEILDNPEPNPDVIIHKLISE
jgi:hypothetical protein